MKKILSILLCFVICISLSGCTIKARGRQKGLETIVSALGFDCVNDEIVMYIETLAVNSEDAEADKNLILNEGKGKSLAIAFANAKQSAVRPFMFSHCAVAVIGESINQRRMREICRFLYNEDEINLSLRFVYTKSAKELLSSDTVTSVAVGYDLLDAIENLSEYSGTVYKNRFYEIESARRNKVNTFSMPNFEVEENGYFAQGSVVFKNDEAKLKLNRDESFIYALLNGNQRKGEIVFNNKAYKIKSAKVKHKFSFDKKLITSLSVDLEISGDNNPRQQIRDKISELFINSKLKGTDIFMLGNKIEKKEHKLWGEIEHNYYSVYKNSQLAVTVK